MRLTSESSNKLPPLVPAARHTSGMAGSRQSSRNRPRRCRLPLVPTTTSSASWFMSTANGREGERKWSGANQSSRSASSPTGRPAIQQAGARPETFMGHG